MGLWPMENSASEVDDAVQVARMLILGCFAPPLLWPSLCEQYAAAITNLLLMLLYYVPACRNGERDSRSWKYPSDKVVQNHLVIPEGLSFL